MLEHRGVSFLGLDPEVSQLLPLEVFSLMSSGKYVWGRSGSPFELCEFRIMSSLSARHGICAMRVSRNPKFSTEGSNLDLQDQNLSCCQLHQRRGLHCHGVEPCLPGVPGALRSCSAWRLFRESNPVSMALQASTLPFGQITKSGSLYRLHPPGQTGTHAADQTAIFIPWQQ